MTKTAYGLISWGYGQNKRGCGEDPRHLHVGGWWDDFQEVTAALQQVHWNQSILLWRRLEIFLFFWNK